MQIPPRQVRLADLITVKAELRLDVLLAEDSTFFADLFCHVIDWQGELYLEDGLHRAVHAALQQRLTLHVRIARLADDGTVLGPSAGSTGTSAGSTGTSAGSTGTSAGSTITRIAGSGIEPAG